MCPKSAAAGVWLTFLSNRQSVQSLFEHLRLVESYKCTPEPRHLLRPSHRPSSPFSKPPPCIPLSGMLSSFWEPYTAQFRDQPIPQRPPRSPEPSRNRKLWDRGSRLTPPVRAIGRLALCVHVRRWLPQLRPPEVRRLQGRGLARQRDHPTYRSPKPPQAQKRRLI